MDTNTLEALNWIAQEIKTGVEVTKSFAIEQTPLLVQETLKWGACQYILQGVFAICSLFLCTFFLLYCWRYAEENQGEESGAVASIGSAVFMLAFGVIIFWLCFSTYNYGKVKIAPRVYIIEQINKFVK